MSINFKHMALSLLISLGSGFMGWFLTRDGMARYDNMHKPWLSPPGWLFVAVWTVLYVIMGIGAYMVYETGDDRRENALTLHICQLLATIGWSLLFFGFEAYIFAFVWLVLLWVLVFFTIKQFLAIKPVAGKMLIPYILWITFAGYLNLAVAVHR
ncbi:MAG: TspO/MBR family protein [Lachnospiraceae bacterium]